VSKTVLDLRGRKVALIERGRGEPLVYLHGFVDVHGVAGDLQPFHLKLSETARLIAPAHPGCAESDDLGDGYAIDDVVFHYLELFDALGLTSFVWSAIASAAGSQPSWRCATPNGCAAWR
jgi:pimeloyl-ACP methyl ester carboxylesterase